MNNKEVHQIVAGIKASLFKNANSFSIGMLKSHFKGSGLKFKEHQVYTHGDDVRFIDWKMLAKTNTPYVKTFEEERNVEITIMLDCTSGMFMGYDGKTKLEAAIEISSLIYLLSGMTKDYVQTIICTGEKIIRVQKKNGEAGVVAFVNALKNEGIINDNGKVNHAYEVKEVDRSEYEAQIVREFYRKRELVILSDFYDFLHGEGLKKLVSRKHVHAFRLLTPLDYADDFNYSIKAKSFKNKTTGVLNMNLISKKERIKDVDIRVKNLLLERRYLEDFVKEML
jgi:hypothetical protein